MGGWVVGICPDEHTPPKGGDPPGDQVGEVGLAGVSVEDLAKAVFKRGGELTEPPESKAAHIAGEAGPEGVFGARELEDVVGRGTLECEDADPLQKPPLE